MAITLDHVREIFKGPENGYGAAFFEHVADNVDWTVRGRTHLLATTRASRNFAHAPSKGSARSSRGVRNFVSSMH